MTINVCAPSSYAFRVVMRCPTCKCRRRFVGQAFVYYDTSYTCCACGDSFAGGERFPRPFRRGWRAEASAAAKRVWVSAGTRAGMVEWSMSELRAEMEFVALYGNGEGNG